MNYLLKDFEFEEKIPVEGQENTFTVREKEIYEDDWLFLLESDREEYQHQVSSKFVFYKPEQEIDFIKEKFLPFLNDFQRSNKNYIMLTYGIPSLKIKLVIKLYH